VLPALVHRVSLATPAADWATTTLTAASHRPLAREDALAGLLQSEFNIERSVQTLMQIYDHGA
jgi:hypothetical protein